MNRSAFLLAALPLLLLACTPKTSVVPDTGNAAEKADIIRVTAPKPNDLVAGTLSITGEARGTWFFEASFPIRLVDQDGNDLAQTHAEAQGEWMTEDFVPFTATLTIPANATDAQKGTLILEKDNPSGQPENAQELRVPVRFH